MNILRRVPRALILLLVPSDFARRNILSQVAVHGISPARVVFLSKAPWGRHLYRAAACDLLLDTFVYGAHTTASDMLWQWVPVVSLAAWGAGRMPSRVAASIVHSLGHEHASASTSTSTSSTSTTGEDASFVAPQPHHAVAYSVAEYEDIIVRYET
jgi:predicted O-linked N-acetylglucosamine transferase (SPINDLY family)